MSLQLPQTQNPFQEFEKWFAEARRAIPHYPNAMTLSTSLDGRPSSRIVLLKELRDEELVFFTNYESRKASHMAKNPWISLSFYWPVLRAQVHFEGTVEKVSRQESEAYFATRPRESQIGAWASQQSRSLSSRETLEQRVSEFEQKFKNQNVPCPPHWGGYALSAKRIEFWLECDFRLHNRILFESDGASWRRTLLNP